MKCTIAYISLLALTNLQILLEARIEITNLGYNNTFQLFQDCWQYMMEDIKDSFNSQNEDPNESQSDVTGEQEEGCDLDEYFDLKDELLSYIKEANESLAAKTTLLQRNISAVSQKWNEVDITKRDSSVKKNSAFIKKLRNLGTSQIDLLIKECQGLNISKYLSEAAAAIVEASIKFTDIPSTVLLCTELNCTYPEFSSFLQVECIKVLTINKDEPVANANRLRIELCFYAELSLCGVIPARQSLPVLGTALTALTADKTFNTLGLILSFCKHCGADFAGLVPRRIRLLADQWGETLNTSMLIGPSKQRNVRNLLCDYYTSLCQHLHNEQLKLTAYENQSRQILVTKGELRPDRISNTEVMRAEIRTLLGGAVTLAELLDMELPDFPDADLQDLPVGDGEECVGALWEDQETRLFYTDLPDVREYLAELNQQEEGKDTDEKGALTVNDVEMPNRKSALETFLKLLPDCLTREKIDNAALEFIVYFNSKTGRKKLIMTLFTVPRSKVELLPFYARFVAILNPVVPEVGSTLCQQLKSEVLRHIRKKEQNNVESKKKTVKFIGELANFRLFAKKEALRILKLLLYDFTHHNIEMACSLLDSCGCALYHASDTHLSTKYYLEQMMRLKTMMLLDARYVTLVETTYFQILPPESGSIPTALNLTPIQQFIAKIIYQDLTVPGSDMTVLDSLRSLDWDSKETVSYTVVCLTSAFNVTYQRIRALAGILSMLVDYQEEAVCHVVDGVLEDIRLGMELNDTSMNQRRVSIIKYLGELYNYRLLDTPDILKVLYSLIAYGVVRGTDDVSQVDPPASVFRIHLVLLLLSTCAFPLLIPDVVIKLEYFLTYFQSYYWSKKASSVWTEEETFPADIVHRFEDVIVSVCPKFPLAENLEDATNAVNSLNSKILFEATKYNPTTDTLLGTVYEENEFGANEEDNDDVERTGSRQTETVDAMQSRLREESDANFLHELNQMFSESVKAIDINTIKPNTDISIPLNYKKTIEDNKHQFVLLLKKGNKQTLKPLTLPSDHEFVISLRAQEEANKQEKERFKRITLDINKRQQDEI